MRENDLMVDTDPRITLAWLLPLRWLTAACQAVAILVAVWLLPETLATGPLLGLVAFGALSNLALVWWLRKPKPAPTALPGLVLALDIVLLTCLLYGSGGPANPFTVIYLVHITLAAVVMRGLWAWGLGLLSIAGYGLLFFWNVHIHALGHMEHGNGMSLHLVGMWVAFAITASLIAQFVGRVTRALRMREEELARLRDLAARQARLASLTTLAAGVAHELGSPLGTIAVAAAELQRAASSLEPPVPSLGEDAALIRKEVARCRGILDQMADPSGALLGEAFQSFQWSVLEGHLCQGLSPSELGRISFSWPDKAPPPLPLQGLIRALRALVSNALDATTDQGHVKLRAMVPEPGWCVEVEDDGLGMTKEVLAQAGEPFFTTKDPGTGMGLGLFLARTFAEQLGGGLNLESRPRGGTMARLHGNGRP